MFKIPPSVHADTHNGTLNVEVEGVPGRNEVNFILEVFSADNTAAHVDYRTLEPLDQTQGSSSQQHEYSCTIILLGASSKLPMFRHSSTPVFRPLLNLFRPKSPQERMQRLDSNVGGRVPVGIAVVGVGVQGSFC